MIPKAAVAATLLLIALEGNTMATAKPTAVSGQPVQVGGNQLGDLSQLLTTLLGSKTTNTSSPGNTAGLEQLLAQLQGTDYNNTLQSVFQQAQGQIPGLQAAFSNAVGARSGNNSSVQAALSKLLQETTLAGQKQVADQQLQNQQAQAQAGNAIAQATKGTTQTSKVKGQGGPLLGILGGLQAALQISGSKDIEELSRKLGFGGSGVAPVAGPVTSQANNSPMGSAAGGVTGAAAPAAQAGGFDLSAMLGGSVVPAWNGGGAMPVAGFDNFSDMFANTANNLATQTGMDPLDALIQTTGGFGTAPGINFGSDFGDFQIDAGYVDPMNFY